MTYLKRIKKVSDIFEFATSSMEIMILTICSSFKIFGICIKISFLFDVGLSELLGERATGLSTNVMCPHRPLEAEVSDDYGRATWFDFKPWIMELLYLICYVIESRRTVEVD